MLEYILDGGYVMIGLVTLSVLSLAVIIDRWRVFRMAEVNAFDLRSRVMERLENGELNEAVDACRGSHGPLAAVLLVGLGKYRRLLAHGRSLAEMETSVSKTMEDYAPGALEVLEKRLNVLALIAAISPLLGMTGTVTGMIRSFNVMAAHGVKANLVAGGISEALITTAAGLLIAIPSVVFYNIFSKKVDRIVVEIDETVIEVLDFITLGAARRTAD